MDLLIEAEPELAALVRAAGVYLPDVIQWRDEARQRPKEISVAPGLAHPFVFHFKFEVMFLGI
jgi:hypothetical protein